MSSLSGRSFFRWLIIGSVGVTACVAPNGGWDVDALLLAKPELANLQGQRLGDMTPYPALDGGQLKWVSCRYDGLGPVWVEGSGSGLSREWVERATESLSGSAIGVELRLAPLVAPNAEKNEAVIHIELVGSADAKSPRGLGDTLAECDVSLSQEGDARFEGRITRAEIRMRAAQRAQTGLIHWVTEEEWIGALMHEFGHALGFAGHVQVGESLMVRDESRLRAIGRRAASGAAQSDPTLEALFRLPAGWVLGEAQLSEVSQRSVDAIAMRVAHWTSLWGPAEGPIATVGDRRARMRWRWPAQDRGLELIFPKWVEEVRGGRPVTAIPSRATQGVLAQPVPGEASS